MRDLLFLLFLSRICGISALNQEATCYAPDGVAAAGNYPCFLDQTVSPCCGGGSICEASGLCRTAGSVGVSELIRGTCTDSTWGSKLCPQFCTDADTGGTNLISCQNVTNSNLDFCCDHTNGCCDSGIGRFQVSLNTDIVTLGSSGATVSTSAPTSTSSSSSSSSATTATTTTTTSSSSTSSTPSNTATTSSSASPTPTGSSGISTGAKAGIGIGCAIVGVAIIGELIYFFLRRRASMKKEKEKKENDPNCLPEMSGHSATRHEMYTQPPELNNYDVDGGRQVAKYGNAAPGTQALHEMEAR